MTIRTLRYVLHIARCNSLSLAAKSLYVSQSTLSVAVGELEQELGIKLFVRTNRGITLTREGQDFLPQARRIVESADELVHRYSEKRQQALEFSVVSQKLPFATRAFNRLLNTVGSDNYTMTMREVTAARVMTDVESGACDVGVAAFSESRLSYLFKTLADRNMVFTELARLPLVAFVRKSHPLASSEYLTVEQMVDYPYVTYEQENTGLKQPQDSVWDVLFPKKVFVSDRSTAISVVRSSDSFAICADLPNSRFAYAGTTGMEIVAVPFLASIGQLVTGTITKNDSPLNAIGRDYVRFLQEELGRLKEGNRFYEDKQITK